MKKVNYFVIFLASIGTLFGQAAQVNFYGYVNASAYYDTRQVVGVREGFFFLYPKNKALDANGNDLNAVGNTRITFIQSRAGVKLSGVEFLGAKTTANLEAEFMGNSDADVNGFRVRHAFVNLDWHGDAVLVGQTWSMLTPPEILPGVIAANGGAPLLPFGRSTQIRYTKTMGAAKLLLALQEQRDYSDIGPNGGSPDYLANAGLPEFHAQVQFMDKTFFGGFGGSYKSLLPTLKTASGLQATEKVPGYAVMAYGRLINEGLTIKLEGVYGANFYENTMISGYAVKSTNPATKEDSYTPIKNYSMFTDIAYGKETEFGLFVGYVKNLGTVDENTGTYYARGNDIDHVLRISPRVCVSSSNVKVCLEVEHTEAAYGTPDKQGKVQNTTTFTNNRFSITTFYMF